MNGLYTREQVMEAVKNQIKTSRKDFGLPIGFSQEDYITIGIVHAALSGLEDKPTPCIANFNSFDIHEILPEIKEMIKKPKEESVFRTLTKFDVVNHN